MSSRGGPWIEGNRSRSASTIALVSSTDSVVCVRYDRFSGSGTWTERASRCSGPGSSRSGPGRWCRRPPRDRRGRSARSSAVVGEPPRLQMHLRNERAGRVQTVSPRLRRWRTPAARPRGPTGRRRRPRAPRSPPRRRSRPGLEVADHVGVVHDLLADVDGPAVGLERALDRLDGSLRPRSTPGSREQNGGRHPPIVREGPRTSRCDRWSHGGQGPLVRSFGHKRTFGPPSRS